MSPFATAMIAWTQLQELEAAQLRLQAVLGRDMVDTTDVQEETARRAAWFRSRGLRPLPAQTLALESLTDDAIRGRL